MKKLFSIFTLLLALSFTNNTYAKIWRVNNTGGVNTLLKSSGLGSVAMGHVLNSNAGTSSIISQGSGSIAMGSADDLGGSDAKILASGQGADKLRPVCHLLLLSNEKSGSARRRWRDRH